MLFIAPLAKAKISFYQIFLSWKIFMFDELEMHAQWVSYWNSN